MGGGVILLKPTLLKTLCLPTHVLYPQIPQPPLIIPSLSTLTTTHSQDLPLLASHHTGPAWTEISVSVSALALQTHSKYGEILQPD